MRHIPVRARDTVTAILSGVLFEQKQGFIPTRAPFSRNMRLDKRIGVTEQVLQGCVQFDDLRPLRDKASIELGEDVSSATFGARGGIHDLVIQVRAVRGNGQDASRYLIDHFPWNRTKNFRLAQHVFFLSIKAPGWEGLSRPFMKDRKQNASATSAKAPRVKKAELRCEQQLKERQ